MERPSLNRSSACVVAALLAQAVACGGDDTHGGLAGTNAADAATSRGGAGAAGGGGASGGAAARDGGQDMQCAVMSGSYDATYSVLSGTCGEITRPTHVPVDAGEGPFTGIQNFARTTVTTEVVRQGCSLRFTQEVITTEGVLELRIETEPLTIDSAGRISGEADVTRFDENGQPECNGTYDVELTLASSTIGVAVDAGATGNDAGAQLPPEVQAEVEYDCVQTVNCRAQRGEQLPDDPLAVCIANTSAVLAADAARLARFRENVARCQAFVVCDYVTCATSML